MLLTRVDVQDICQITGNDDLIEKLIPLAEARFFSLTGNYFPEREFMVSSNNVVINSTSRTVTMSGVNLETEGFTSNRHLIISGSLLNDGIFAVESVSGSTITLASGSVLESESSGRSIILTRSKIPADVPMIIAMMIGWTIDNKALKGKQSVKLGDYSETLGSANVADYPKMIKDGIETFKVLQW